MSFEKKERKPLIALFVVAVGASVSLPFFSRGCDPSSSSTLLSSKYLFQKREAPGKPPAAPTAPAEKTAAEHSSMEALPWLARGEEPSNPPEPAGAASAQAPTPGEVAGTPPAPAAPPAPAFSAEEKEALERTVGSLDPEKASRIGAQQGLTPRIAMKLLDHPKLLSFLLNNKMLVAAVMSQGAAQKNCSDQNAMMNYFSDAKSSNGIGATLDLLMESTKHPGATKALTQNALVSAIIHDCPAISHFKDNPASMVQIVKSNPEIVSLVSNPDIISSIAAADKTGALPSMSQVYQAISGN